MEAIGSGIDRVRVYAVSAGIGRDGRSVDEPLSAIVKWQSVHNDKLHQLYVNGRFAAVTCDRKQKELRLQLPSCWKSVSNIEIYAVKPEFGNIDFSNMIGLEKNCTRIRLSWARQQSIPVDCSYAVYSNNGLGEIDHSEAISAADMAVWPVRQEKCGFGLSRFGVSDFGFDGSASVGFGRGNFGQGDFGFDADELQWISDELDSGRYKYAVKVMDKMGSIYAEMYSDEITVVRQAKGVTGLAVKSCDDSSGTISFEVN